MDSDPIMSPILALDSFLLEKVFQKFSNFFQRMTGKTCFFLARALFLIAAVFCGMIVLWVTFASKDTDYYVMFLCFLGIFLFFSDVNEMQGREKDFEENIEAAKNRDTELLLLFRRLSHGAIALFAVFLFPTATEKGREFALLLFVIVFLASSLGNYFASCTPLPPGKSRIREWIGNLGKRLELCPTKE